MRRWIVALVCLICLTGLGAAQPQKKQQINITAAGPMDIDFEKRVASVSDNVRLTTEDGTIAADKMDFTFDEKFAIVSLAATGHVHVKVKTVTEKKVERHIDAQADSATYERKDRLMTLKGNVRGKIVQPARRLTIDLSSEKASIWLDEDRVRLEPANVVITQPKETPEAAAPKQ